MKTKILTSSFGLLFATLSALASATAFASESMLLLKCHEQPVQNGSRTYVVFSEKVDESWATYIALQDVQGSTPGNIEIQTDTKFPVDSSMNEISPVNERLVINSDSRSGKVFLRSERGRGTANIQISTFSFRGANKLNTNGNISILCD